MHFPSGMIRHNILTLADFFSHTVQNSVEHVLFPYCRTSRFRQKFSNRLKNWSYLSSTTPVQMLVWLLPESRWEEKTPADRDNLPRIHQ